MKEVLIISGEALQASIYQLILYSVKKSYREKFNFTYDFTVLSQEDTDFVQKLSLKKGTTYKTDISGYDIVIFFYFIPSQGYFLNYSRLSKFYYLGNYFPLLGPYPISDMQIDLELFHFFGENSIIPNIIEKSFPLSQVNQAGKIFLPSGIDDGKRYSYVGEYKFDIVITLGIALDFSMVSELLEKLQDLRILIIASDHPNKEVTGNIHVIQEWRKYKNVIIFPLVSTKLLRKLILSSRVLVLPFFRNHPQNVTRVSDALYLGKKVISSDILAHKGMKNVIICHSENEFITQIQTVLTEKVDQRDTLSIQEYYETHFRVDMILENIFLIGD